MTERPHLTPNIKRAVIQAVLVGRHRTLIAREQGVSESTVRRIEAKVSETIARSTEPLDRQVILAKLEGYIQS